MVWQNDFAVSSSECCGWYEQDDSQAHNNVYKTLSWDHFIEQVGSS